MEPEEVEVDIDLGEELDIDVLLEEDIDIEINFEGHVTIQEISAECPVIDIIFGGVADSDEPGSLFPYAIVNGLIEGCGA